MAFFLMAFLLGGILQVVLINADTLARQSTALGSLHAIGTWVSHIGTSCGSVVWPQDLMGSYVTVTDHGDNHSKGVAKNRENSMVNFCEGCKLSQSTAASGAKPWPWCILMQSRENASGRWKCCFIAVESESRRKCVFFWILFDNFLKFYFGGVLIPKSKTPPSYVPGLIDR